MKFSRSKLKKTLKIEKLLLIYNTIKDIKKINILEFGVRAGISTNMFTVFHDEALIHLVILQKGRAKESEGANKTLPISVEHSNAGFAMC